jgi:AcrR family transcriptional regulator
MVGIEEVTRYTVTHVVTVSQELRLGERCGAPAAIVTGPAPGAGRVAAGATAGAAVGAAGGRSVDEQAVLDAAEASLVAVGVRRTTLTDVARRAGVSRMTLYRHWPDLRCLVSDVMTREWTRLVTASAPPAPRPGAPDVAREHLVEHIVATVEAFRVNRLFRKIVDTDPELLLPYVLDRRGATQQLIVDLLAEQLADAQAAGFARAGDADAQARMLLLIAQSFVLSAGAIGADMPYETLVGELRRLLDAYLAPPAHPCSPPRPPPASRPRDVHDDGSHRTSGSAPVLPVLPVLAGDAAS